MSDIVISGYYGLGNSGDEALLEIMVKDLREVCPEVTITALSGNSGLTSSKYGIKTVNRFNLFSVLKELKKSGLLISGGGTLIQDATSTKSLLYYLFIIYAAKKMGKKVMLYANGIGPIKDKNIKYVKHILNNVDIITLRENDSLKEIERCGITSPPVTVTADPAFNLMPASDEKVSMIFDEFNIPKDKKLVAVSLRDWKYLPPDFENDMASFLEMLSSDGYYAVFVPMQLSTDLDLSERTAGKMKCASSVVTRELSVSEILALIGNCSIACGMRLHMLIFASVMNVPMAGIVYDPKIRGFMEYMNQKMYIDLCNFNTESFYKLVSKCIQNYNDISEKLAHTSSLLRKKAKKNAEIAIELLKK